RGAVALPSREAHRVASDVLVTLDRDAGSDGRKGPQWLFAEGLRALFDPKDPPAELAHLRRALASTPHARLWIDEATLTRALEARANVVLEEELPTRTGLVTVLGIEPVGRVLLVQDARGTYLRSVDEQWRRSALFGRSALVVGDALESKDIAHDAGLDRVDACFVDERGDIPPQARIAELAGEVIAETPDVPLAHKLLGEAYLQQYKTGSEEPDALFRWYAATRERFPDAEWPLQIYAETLETMDRLEEAGIAWADAAVRDPLDERNVMGEARVLSRLGWESRAERLFRKAITLRPDGGFSYARCASIALNDGRLVEARAAAEVATDLAPDDLEGWLALATVEENERRWDDAEKALVRAAGTSEKAFWPRIRLVRRHVASARWDDARRVADEALARAPGASVAWVTAAGVAWEEGDLARAWDRILRGIQRCGARDDLVDHAVMQVALGADEDAFTPQLDALVLSCGTNASSTSRIARELEGYHRWDASLVVCERALAATPDSLGPMWWTVQALRARDEVRRDEKARARVSELVERIAADAPGFLPARVLQAELALEVDANRALSVLGQIDVSLAPAVVWELAARALDRLERGEEADEVRGRISQALPAGAYEHASMLRALGSSELALGLLRRARAEHPDHLGVRQQLAVTLLDAGDREGALEEALGIEEKDAGAVPWDPAIRAAGRLGRWDVVERLSGRAIDELRDSRIPMDRFWQLHAYRAVALLQRGDGTARDELLQRVPRSPDALLALVRAQGWAKSELLEEDRARLFQVAKGALASLASEEVAS
ncbi:MAG TPA: hypothetical protein VNO21_11440, partial [Polyangiaceae bacterium]|nr:hypothetical protein [Polyangiaceae bacterium]